MYELLSDDPTWDRANRIIDSFDSAPAVEVPDTTLGGTYVNIEWLKRTEAELKKYQEMAQAEKDGRLVVLPCKTGDTLWSFYNYPKSGICKIVVTAVSTLDGITVINTDNYGVIPEKDIGKTVFLTRKEAEAALKKREEVGL